jgi:hypothetical protein
LAPVTSGAKLYLGVPDDYSVPANEGDFFRPGGSQMAPGMDQSLVPSGTPHLPQYATGQENAVLGLSVENIARLQARLATAGLIGPKTKVRVGMADNATMSAYKALLTFANRYAISETDALAMLESNPVINGDGSASGASSAPTTSTSTNTSTTNLTSLDAEQIANTAYQDALGANAAPKQQKALQAALQAYAGAHPNISKTTSTRDPTTGNTDSSTTSSGGVDAGGLAQVAQNQAMAAPDYAEVQAATTYFNALVNSLGPSTGGG